MAELSAEKNYLEPALPARRSVAVILVAITALAIGILFFVSLAYFKTLDQEDAKTRLLLYERSLNDTFERYQHLPFVLAHDPHVAGGLHTSNRDALNRRLASFADEANLEAIYLMDASGLVLSASNYDKPQSFLGQNYSFRPYFAEAMDGHRGNYFGIGVTTGRPGYFVSEPVRDSTGEIAGVIAIKLDASELQETWEAGGENVLVSNIDGIVVLASNRDWLYRSLQPLSPERLTQISSSKQFGTIDVSLLDWTLSDETSVSLNGVTYIYAVHDVDHLSWRVHYLLGEGRAYERALLTTIVFGSGVSLLVGFAAYLRSKRIEAALAASHFDRAQLRKTNRQLEDAHGELARSSKLAALGQLSASVVHELGQPISALRNYLIAEELDQAGIQDTTLKRLNGVVDRMENITKQLRFFTRPLEPNFEPVFVADIISGCVELMHHDLDKAHIRLKVQNEAPAMMVLGSRFRLEQAVVNLVKNATSSLQEAERTQLCISVRSKDNSALIAVRDNGIGFGERELNLLQEPFHTTRASGDGMGLGLSIATEIIKEHDGSLSAKNVADGGAEFTIHLPAYISKESSNVKEENSA